ncbi:hypothetical protein [Streptomyces sp. NPDC051109]|uniref:hypothetical protein n=1 Tax=Streptomyces sp. NPDC051109 TaxID=3365642 RepID=UPI00378BF28E
MATRLASGRAQDDPAPVGRRAERKKAAHAPVREFLAQGHSRRAIARHLGWGLNTVVRYANAARWQDTIRESRPRPNRLDPHKCYLERRFAEGCTSVTRLHGELVASHAPVAYQMVRSQVATLREAPAGAPPRPPTVRQLTGWLTRDPTALSEDDRPRLKDVLARRPKLVTAAGLVRDFVLLRDLDAVTAGLTLHWSSGNIEWSRQPHQEGQKAALRTSWHPPAAEDEPAPVAPQYKDGAEAQPSRWPFSLKMITGSLLAWADGTR